MALTLALTLALAVQDEGRCGTWMWSNDLKADSMFSIAIFEQGDVGHDTVDAFILVLSGEAYRKITPGRRALQFSRVCVLPSERVQANGRQVFVAMADDVRITINPSKRWRPVPAPR